jgi:2-dehydropantoate 2-reductase
MSQILVFGAGGAGGYFAARLAAAGRDVTVIARGAHLRAIRAGGLVVESVAGDVTVRVPAMDDPAGAGVAGIVLVGVKTWQVSDAARSIRPVVGPATVVVPLQNGVEAADRLADVLGDGRIRHVGGPGSIEVGERDGRRTDRAQNVRDSLDVPGMSAVVSPDIRVALWEKLLMVVPFGSVGAVTRAPVGVLRSLPGTSAMLERAMAEIRAVASARGVVLDDLALDRAHSFLQRLPESGTSSLQRDIAAGRPSELDDWCGAVVRLGSDAGVPTPVHAFIHDSLRPLEQRARGRLSFE